MMVYLKYLKYGALAVAILGLLFVGWKGRAVLAERDALRTEMTAAAETVDRLEAALQLEQEAAAHAATARADAERALTRLRKDRASDPEAVEWGAAPVPTGEQERLCAALPGLEGCDGGG